MEAEEPIEPIEERRSEAGRERCTGTGQEVADLPQARLSQALQNRRRELESSQRQTAAQCRNGGLTRWGDPDGAEARERPGGLDRVADRGLPGETARRQIGEISLSRSAASPPKRCVTPVMSSSTPSGGSSAVMGVKRSPQSPIARKALASWSGSAGAVASAGQIAQASASVMPGRIAAAAAAVSTAAMRCAHLTASTVASGPSGAPCRRSRSVGSVGNQRLRRRGMDV